MAIQVYCQCGNAMSVRPELGGKKVKCKTCGVVLRIPEVPLDESAEAPPPPLKPDPAKPPSKPPAKAAAAPAPAPDAAGTDPSEYEVVKEGELQISCPACGAHCAPGDAACLACGAELGGGGAAGVLSKVPRPVLFAVIGLVGFGLLGFVGHTLWTSSRPASYTRDGMTRISSKDWKGARAAFEAALTFDKAYEPAALGLAEVGMGDGDPQLIERYGERAIKAATDTHQRAKLRLAFARVKLEGGDYKTARNQAVDAKDEDPDVAGAARGIIGISALLAGQEDEALAELRFAASQRSEEPRVYRELTTLLTKRGELVEARTNAEQSVKLEPENPEQWLKVAELRQATQDQPGAKQALEKVIELKSDSALGHSRLSAILLAEGSLELAQKSAEKACELAPEDLEARLAMGRVLLALDRPKAAQDELEKATKLGSSWEVEFLLGQSMLQTNDVASGCRRIQAALDKRQDDLPLHLQAARLAIAANAGPAAVGFLQRMLKSHDDDYDLHLLLSQALAAQADQRARNDAQIQEHLKRCMDLSPDRREAPAILGAYLLEKLDSEAAIEVLKRGLQRNPQDKELLFLKGRACIRAKKWDEAIDALQSLEALDRAYPDLDQWLRRAREGKFYGE